MSNTTTFALYNKNNNTSTKQIKFRSRFIFSLYIIFMIILGIFSLSSSSSLLCNAFLIPPIPTATTTANNNNNPSITTMLSMSTMDTSLGKPVELKYTLYDYKNNNDSENGESEEYDPVILLHGKLIGAICFFVWMGVGYLHLFIDLTI